MATNNRFSDAENDCVRAIAEMNIFGKCNPNDFETAESEKRQREEQFRLERKKREKELKKMEEERQRQEREDYEFALQEHLSLNGYGNMKSSVPRVTGRGKFYDITPPSRGRQENRLITRRDENFLNQIHQVMGESAYNNNAQLQFWHGDQLKNQRPNSSQSNQSSEQFEDARTSHRSPFTCSPMSENFQSTSSSSASSPYLSNESENSPVRQKVPSPFHQVEASSVPPSQIFPPLRPDAGPTLAPEEFPALSSPSKSARRPRNRLAAKFSNMPAENEEEPSNNVPQEQDPLAVLGSLAKPLVPPKMRGSNSVSINDLNPSMRMMRNSGIKIKVMRENDFSRTNRNSTLNEEDFPPL